MHIVLRGNNIIQKGCENLNFRNFHSNVFFKVSRNRLFDLRNRLFKKLRFIANSSGNTHLRYKDLSLMVLSKAPSAEYLTVNVFPLH